MGLDVRRDPLCLIQISSGKGDAHIIQFDRKNYEAPNLINVLADEKYYKNFSLMEELIYPYKILS